MNNHYQINDYLIYLILASINNLNAVYADKFYLSSSTGVSEISDTYATKTEPNNVNNSTEVTANTDAIAVLNTKQLQNFNNVNAINTDLTNNYQTNTTLAINFYNRSEVDTILFDYYTSTQIDSNLSINCQNNAQLVKKMYNTSEIDTNYQTNTQLATNYYNKTEVDALVSAVTGHTNQQIDDKLNLKEDVATFTDNISFCPLLIVRDQRFYIKVLH